VLLAICLHYMEQVTKRYWKGVEELRNDATFVKNAQTEFAEPTGNDLQNLLDGTNAPRRDFLKTLGFGMAAVSLAACEAPVRKAIPYLNKPEGAFPSISDYYASTYTDGGDYASILVETREGRPIKIEGNPLSSISKGGTTARVQASLLSLYDNEKLRGPRKGEQDITWATADKEISSQLTQIAGQGGQRRLLLLSLLQSTPRLATLCMMPILHQALFRLTKCHLVRQSCHRMISVKHAPLLALVLIFWVRG
jgi:MoCo/4Fe-4S cofactor protein with predicted Tat translocation signal